MPRGGAVRVQDYEVEALESWSAVMLLEGGGRR
jgi:hypothetical protein